MSLDEKIKKAGAKCVWLIYLPFWLIMLSGYTAFNFLAMICLSIKKTKMVRRIIYSDFIQTQKEKFTGRPKITKQNKN